MMQKTEKTKVRKATTSLDDIPTQLSEPGFVGKSANADIRHPVIQAKFPCFSHLTVANKLHLPAYGIRSI